MKKGSPNALFLSLCVFMFACATYPQSGEDQACYHANKALVAISKDECLKAATQIEMALCRPTGDTRIRELFACSQKARDCYVSYLKKQIDDISSLYQATSMFRHLTVAKSAKILLGSEPSELFTRLNKAVAEGNKTGAIPFLLGDKIDVFPELKSPEHQNYIVERTISKLQCNGGSIYDFGSRRVAALMKYVEHVGVASVEAKRIESLLPTMNIRRHELDVVAEVFPEFATTRKEEMTAGVFLQVKDGDRLLKEDLLEVFQRQIRGVEWVPSPGPKITTLIIELVRNNERVLPTQTQNITYGISEVNILDAALRMPVNASYAYELITDGAEIEYGYVVSAVLQGKVIHEKVIRGKVKGESVRCENARIQNALGGVTAANFVANDDMEQRCSGPCSVSLEDLRKQVFSEIVAGVLEVPTIKAVHEIN